MENKAFEKIAALQEKGIVSEQEAQALKKVLTGPIRQGKTGVFEKAFVVILIIAALSFVGVFCFVLLIFALTAHGGLF